MDLSALDNVPSKEVPFYFFWRELNPLQDVFDTLISIFDSPFQELAIELTPLSE